MTSERSGSPSVLRRWWQERITGYQAAAQPAFPTELFPDNFAVGVLADTGVYVVENFCTPEEADDIVRVAAERLAPSGVLVNNRFEQTKERSSHTAALFSRWFKHPGVVPLMQRAAALVGLPYTNIEDVYVTRYREGDFYAQHIDYGDSYPVDRLYTVLVYLNDVPEQQGGATVFPSLRAAVRPAKGVAVSWTNKNPDGSGHLESNHAAFPVTGDGEKWAIQFWFRNYRVVDSLQHEVRDLPLYAGRERQPLTSDDSLPEGVRCLD